GLRGARHDRMVAVAHDDVADTHGDANSPRTLDLSAAHLDAVAVTDVFLDRRGKPRCGHVEVDGTRTEAPPQAAEAAGENQEQCPQDDRKPSDPAFADEPAPERPGAINEDVEAGVGGRQQPLRATARLVVLVIPVGVIPLRLPGVSAWFRTLWRRAAYHCVSVLALIARLVAAKSPSVDTQRRLPCRHRYQSSPSTHIIRAKTALRSKRVAYPTSFKHTLRGSGPSGRPHDSGLPQ